MYKLKVENVIFPLILLLLCLLISFVNYVPGTFLTGWDNLHPEFNLGLNVRRAIFSVWQEYQGLGLLTGNAHSASILHTLFMAVLSGVGVSLNLMRYCYHFLALLFGVLGMYFLLNKLKLAREISFIGALFYCLNLGTVQIFFTPYISFSHFYASLPWILYSLIRFSKDSSKKNFLLFVFINFLATPSFYIPTIFLVYLICLLLFLLTVAFKKGIFLKVLIAVFFVNSFWFLPFIYFIFNNLAIRFSALSGSMSSDILFMENVKYGNLGNTLLLKGFWFGNVDLQISSGKFDYMLRLWIDYMQNTPIMVLGYILSLIVFLGFLTFIVSSVSKKQGKGRALVGFAGIFLISLFFLLNENFPVGFLYRLLRTISPLFAEVFRFPFTKWIVPAVLSYSVFFAIGASVILKKLKRLRPLVLIAILTVLLIIWMFPIFKGNLIYTDTRVQIPNEYFELFDFFKSVPKTERIANFPQYTFWGWNYYNWGYRGSGFLWYGIEQPILDRAFDVWNIQNENYYKDISYALYSENPQLFYDVLNKYQVNWVLVDTNVVQPEGVLESLYISKLETILENNPKIVLAKDLGNIKVYKVVLNYFPQNFLYFSKNVASSEVIRGDIHEINANIVQEGGKGYTINFEYPLKTTKSEILEKYFNKENLVPVEIWARLVGESLDLKILYKIPLFEEQETALFKNIVVSGQTDFILSVNSTKFFPIKFLSNEYKFYGSALLSTKEENIVNVYSSKTEYSKKFLAEDFIDTVYSCSDYNEESIISASLDEGAVKLSGKNSAPCFLLKEVMNKSYEYNLVSTTYGYKSLAGELPEYCLLTDPLGKCLNNKFGNRPRTSLDWSFYTDFVEFPKKDYSGEISLSFALDAYEEERTIWYKDILLSLYPLISSTKIENSLDTLLSNYGDDESLNINSMQFSKTYFVSGITAESQLHSQYARNCDSFNSLFVHKEIKEGAITYYSKNAVNCEDFELLNLPQNIGYVFSVDAQNLKGLPLSFCISNVLSKRCDVVNKAKDGENYLILPAMSSNMFSLGYVFHLDSTSIGNIETVNRLDNIFVYYYPSLFIKSLFEGSRVGNKLDSNASVVEGSVRYNSAFYKFDVKLSNDNKSTLIFGQSFDKGWVLLRLSDKKIIKSHKIVNGWANGWELERSKEGALEESFYIFYWPQVLEFAGFALLLLVIPLAVVKRRVQEPI